MRWHESQFTGGPSSDDAAASRGGGCSSTVSGEPRPQRRSRRSQLKRLARAKDVTTRTEIGPPAARVNCLRLAGRGRGFFRGALLLRDVELPLLSLRLLLRRLASPLRLAPANKKEKLVFFQLRRLGCVAGFAHSRERNGESNALRTCSHWSNLLISVHQAG